MADTATIAAPDSIHTSDAAHRRLKRRYAFETRFKVFGIAAITLAILALVSLLWTVFSNAFGALYQTNLVLPVSLSAERIDPGATNDPSVIRRGDFEGAVKEALRTALPAASGRRERRELYGLVSDGAALDLRELAMANPSVIGSKEPRVLLASDDANLWIKGYLGSIETLPTDGRATPIGTTGSIEIVAEANVFQPLLTVVKESLLKKAAAFERQAMLQQRGVSYFENLLSQLGDDASEQRADYERQITGYKNREASFTEKADAIRKRAEAPGGREAVDSDLSSFLVRINGGVVKVREVSADTVRGDVILPLASEAPVAANAWQLQRITSSEVSRKVSDRQIVWLEELRKSGNVSVDFNTRLFTSSNSRESELAGVWGAAVGSFWTMLVTFCLAFPIGVMAAIYLEEFAPKNAITSFIEVNINNLAAVPSIVFGLLGLAVVIEFFGEDIFNQDLRSTALAGGIVLALMTLPTIIIAARAAIKAVPPSIREAALGVGASKVQAVSHHVLPLAMPGILTGTIIGMAQALGETAPLLMIGMFAFIKDVPTGVMDDATALPVQVYQWSDFPERLFEMKTAAAIVVLLLFLITMNAIAVLLRRRFERKW
ncbi:MAG: phosphate ABC transporter permease PstA [Pseudomonadota bacterium]